MLLYFCLFKHYIFHFRWPKCCTFRKCTYIRVSAHSHFCTKTPILHANHITKKVAVCKICTNGANFASHVNLVLHHRKYTRAMWIPFHTGISEFCKLITRFPLRTAPKIQATSNNRAWWIVAHVYYKCPQACCTYCKACLFPPVVSFQSYAL
jgi:hypothetical protein